FAGAGGVRAAGLARWKDGAWSAVPASTGSDFDGYVHRTFAVDAGTGPELWVFGDFSYVGTRVAERFARWTCGLILKDGFESGGFGAWDAAVGAPGGP